MTCTSNLYMTWKLTKNWGWRKIQQTAWGYYGFPVTLEHYLTRNAETNVHIETRIGKNCQKAISVGYEKDSRRLSIKNSSISTVCSTWKLQTWIEKINLEQVNFEDVRIKSNEVRSLITTTTSIIKKIKFHNCSLSQPRGCSEVHLDYRHARGVLLHHTYR